MANRMLWIKCAERMPEDMPEYAGRDVIKVIVSITGKNGRCARSQTRHRHKGEWRWRMSAGTVTDWMPMPKPPTDKPKTNFEAITESVEALACGIEAMGCPPVPYTDRCIERECEQCWEDWLNQPWEGEE